MMDPVALEKRLNRIEQSVEDAHRVALEAQRAVITAVAETAMLRQRVDLVLVLTTASVIISVVVLSLVFILLINMLP